MGGSEYYRILGLEGGRVPRVYPEKTKKKMESLLKAMDRGLVKSCHDLSEGGLLVSAVEMALGGDLGIELDLGNLGALRTDFKLFSESNGRWLMEVEKEDSEEFERLVPAERIGIVTNGTEVSIRDGRIGLKFSINELRDRWNSAVEREI